MREFETTFVIQPEISDEALVEFCSRLDSILEKEGARRVMLDDWGKRKLAYEINRFQKGHYFVLYYLDEGKVVPELERTLRLDESVLRFLTVRAKDKVDDPDARVAEGIEQERVQKEKAAERAAREAEAEAERAAREAEYLANRDAEAAQAADAEAAPEAEASDAPATETADATAEPEAGEAAADSPAEERE